jgi:hypothetical protein
MMLSDKMLSDNMLSDKINAYGWKNKLSDNILSDNMFPSDNIVLLDNMLSYFLKTSHTHKIQAFWHDQITSFVR